MVDERDSRPGSPARGRDDHRERSSLPLASPRPAATHVAGDLSGLLEAAGFEIRRAVLYEARAAGGVSTETRGALEAGTLDGVLLFSPRTAALFAELVTDAGLSEACREMSAYCLSPAVAEKAQSVTWRDVVVAAESNQEALLRALGA